jgi:hypothetical protein
VNELKPGIKAMDAELAKLREWGTEAARIRADKAMNELKNSGAWDQAVAMRDLQRQINEGQK